MKIAITASSKNEDSDIDPRFGRTPFIYIYDLETGTGEFIDNKLNLNAASGAGIQTAQNVSETNAKVVITGNCGPNAFKTLYAGNIKLIIGASGKIKEAIEKFKNNEFTYANDANVEGHW